MASYPITSVGGIDELEFGASSVYNYITYTEPDGFSALGFSFSRISNDVSGRLVSFDFITSIKLGLSFHFGSINKLVTSAFVDALQFGKHTIHNYKTYSLIDGFFDEEFSYTSRVLQYPFAIYLNLTDLPTNTMALHFSWEQRRVVVLGKLDSSSFGEIYTTNHIGAYNVSAEDQTSFGMAFTHADAELYLNFTSVFGPGTTFLFGDQILASVPTGFVASSFGLQSVVSHESHASIVGTSNTLFGFARVATDTGYLYLDFNRVIRPNASNIAFYWGDARELLAPGILGTTFGDTLVSKWLRIVRPFGYRNLRWGTAELSLDGIPRIWEPLWLEYTNFGQATIYNSASIAEFFSPQGIDEPPQTQWGVPEEYYAVGYVERPPVADEGTSEYFGFAVYIRQPQKIIVAPEQQSGDGSVVVVWPPYTQWGVPARQIVEVEGADYEGTFQVAFQTRWIIQLGSVVGQVGTAEFGHSPRYLFPFWFVTFEPGEHTVGRETVSEGPTFNSNEFGRPHVAWGNVLFAEGIASTASVNKAIWVSRAPRHLLHKQWAGFFGPSLHTKIWNSRQYVTFFPTEEYRHKAEYGVNAHIYNVNRTIRPSGLNSLRFQVQFEGVFLTGRGIVLPELNATQWGPDTFIADAVRYYTPMSWDNLYVARYTFIHNAARNFTPESLANEQEFGLHKIWDIRQWVTMWQFYAAQFGTHFIAYAVREIVQRRLWFPHTVYGTQYIGLFEQFFEPPSIEPPTLGEFVVTGKPVPTITSRWPMTNLNRFGNTTRIWNFNPQVWATGFRWEIFGGRNWVSHSPRYLEPLGPGPLYFPRPVIADRDRTFQAHGSNMLIVPAGLHVRNVNPDPPGPLMISFESTIDEETGELRDDGKGIFHSAPDFGFGNPWFQINHIILADEGIDAFDDGDTWIRVQGCITKTYEHSHRVGIPFMGCPLYVTDLVFDKSPVGPFDNEDREPQATQWGKPTVSPQTIWCQSPPPEQALYNHTGEWFLWPHCHKHNGCSPWFGRLTVTNQHRAVYHYHKLSIPNKSQVIGGWIGRPVLTFGTQYITFDEPPAGQCGIPSFTPRTLRIYASGLPRGTAFGEHTIHNVQPTLPDDQYKIVGGGALTQFGIFRVDPITLFVNGFSATLWGDNDPMVHFPRHLYVEGLDATLYGDNWLSHWIRSVFMDGTAPPLWWMTLFEDKMLVIGGELPITYNYIRITPDSFDAVEFGDILPQQYAERIITPYMIAGACILPTVFTISHA